MAFDGGPRKAHDVKLAALVTATTLVALVIALGIAPAPAVYGCSAGSDYDAVADSDLIVVGQVVAWRARPGRASRTEFTPVEVTIAVERVLKGAAGDTVAAFDDTSYLAQRDTWAGGAGACGAFHSDPAGAYVILGLKRGEDGSLTTNRLRSFYVSVGGRPEGRPGYELALERLGAAIPVRPPATGSAGLLTPPP